MKVQTFLDCMGEIDERFLDVEPSPQENAAEDAAAPREMIPSAVPPAEAKPGHRFVVILRRVLPFAVTAAACIGGIVLLASLRPRDDYTFYQGSGYEAEVTQDQPRDGSAASDSTGTTVTTAPEPEAKSGTVTADTNTAKTDTAVKSESTQTQSAQTTTKPGQTTEPQSGKTEQGSQQYDADGKIVIQSWAPQYVGKPLDYTQLWLNAVAYDKQTRKEIRRSGFSALSKQYSHCWSIDDSQVNYSKPGTYTVWLVSAEGETDTFEYRRTVQELDGIIYKSSQTDYMTVRMKNARTAFQVTLVPVSDKLMFVENLYPEPETYVPITAHSTNIQFSDSVKLMNVWGAEVTYDISDTECLKLERVDRTAQYETVLFSMKYERDVTLTASTADGRKASVVIHGMNVEDYTPQDALDAREFYVAVGTFNGQYTQLRYFSPKNASGLNAEKAVWKDAPAGIQYGDIFVADGTVSLSKVQTAPDDPANEMLYHYEIGSGSRLKKVGTCAELMQPKNLTVTNCDYDGSSHWSILYEDPETGQTYYYGLATYGSALGIDPHDCETGDVYTFAMFGDNLIVPLAKKSAASPHKVMQMTSVAEVEREGDRAAGDYVRRIAELKGEIKASAPRITVEAVKALIDSGMTYSEIERKLEEQYRYPDFCGGSGMTRYEYWLDNTGTDVILLGHESEQIIHLMKRSPECELWEVLLG